MNKLIKQTLLCYPHTLEVSKDEDQIVLNLVDGAGNAYNQIRLTEEHAEALAEMLTSYLPKKEFKGRGYSSIADLNGQTKIDIAVAEEVARRVNGGSSILDNMPKLTDYKSGKVDAEVTYDKNEMYKVKSYNPKTFDLQDIPTNLPRGIVEEVGLSLYSLPGYTASPVMWNKKDGSISYRMMDKDKKSDMFKVTLEKVDKSW